jgi:hypothetical protein
MALKYPKGERVWLAFYSGKHELQYIITSKENNREFYFLYTPLPDGTFKKFGKSRSPAELEERFLSSRKERPT